MNEYDKRDAERRRLEEYNDEYRKGTPKISDSEYDALEERFRKNYPDDEWFSRGVNDKAPSKDREYRLPFPMMSLNKVKTFSALMKWAKEWKNATFIVTPKFDGLSIGLDWERAWTRGDGETGQICTNHMFSAYDYPELISKNTILRGEAIIPNEQWKEFKKRHPEAMSQRNSTTGLINGDFSPEKEEDYRLIRMMVYDVYGEGEMSKKEQLGLSRIPVPFMEFKSVEEMTPEVMEAFFFECRKDFPMDGLVVDVNEPELRHETEANGNPVYSIAYKHPSFTDRAKTKIKAVEKNVNRQGIVTPVIILEPSVILSGAEISRVSGINMKYVMEWKMFPGEEVEITRSGEVIPKITGVGGIHIPFREMFDDADEYRREYSSMVLRRLPAMLKEPQDLCTCPVCGTRLQPFYTEESPEMYCPNDSCPSRKLQGVLAFFRICGLDGFGEAKLTQLVDKGLIGNRDFDAFRLERKDLEGLEGWGDKSIDDFLSKLYAIRHNGLCAARFMHATGYFGDLGEKTLQKILDGLKNVDDYTLSEVMDIEGIQFTTASKFLGGMARMGQNCMEIYDLFSFSYVKTEESAASEGPLKGDVICFTGFRDKALAKTISDLGGIVSDSFTKAVNILVVKDKGATSSKIDKARKNGTKIMTRDELVSVMLVSR